jgi:ComF family protein
MEDSMLKTVPRLLFGGTCFLCHGPARELLCGACDADLPRLAAPRCPRCALAWADAAVCGRCLVRAPCYDATLAALDYRFPADTLIHALKFGGELGLAPLLGKLLAARIAGEPPVDCLVPVPLSRARLRQRGYNQALEIARTLAAATGALLEAGLCERTRDTPPQTALPWAVRRRNVRGAFRCTRDVAGARVALIDDVMTTGATLDALALALKESGAVRVVNWVVARTSPPD